MKLKLMTVLAGVALLSAGVATNADAYRSNNSKWTDNNNVSWSGTTGGFVKATSNNHIRATSWARYCNLMTFSGTTSLSAPGSGTTTLTDYWSVGSPGTPSVSFPAGVSVGGGGSSATWSTNMSRTTQTHSYVSHPITFNAGSM